MPIAAWSIFRAGPISSSRNSLLVAAELLRELGDEGLHGKGARHVGHRAEPADAGVRHRLAVLAADRRDVERHVGRSPCRSPTRRGSPRPGAKVELDRGRDDRGAASRSPCRRHRPPPRSGRPSRCGRSRAGCRPRGSTAPAPARRPPSRAAPPRARSRTSTCARSRRRAASGAPSPHSSASRARRPPSAACRRGSAPAPRSRPTAVAHLGERHRRLHRRVRHVRLVVARALTVLPPRLAPPPSRPGCG